MPHPDQTSASPAAASPTRRTLAFVVVALVCVGITVAVELASRPAPIQEFGRVGEEFYPDFTDPTLATGLEVYAFDKEEVLPQEFIVRRQPNGRWTIPSHHNYPADAEDRLGRTAASLIGIRRGALVTRWPADHARYGVVNPRQDSLKVDEVDGVGKRIILTGEGDSVLADFIIGNRADSDSTDEYYVRHPDEDEVYIASLDIDLSTKFTDWIDTDLLDVFSSDVRRLTINDYTFDELQRTITQGVTSVLSRDSASDPWTLEGLDESTEEVNTDAVNDAVSAIVGMEIIGVRPKLPGLTPDLKLDRNAIQSQEDVDRLQTDLMARGFLLQPDETPGSLKLIAREGELFATTDDGLTYHLYFGRAFTGTQEELEIGFSSKDDSAEESDTDEDGEAGTPDDAAADTEQNEKTDENGDGGSDDDDEEDSDSDSQGSQPGRYLFIRVDFSESDLEPPPEKPVEPEMPPELKEEAEQADDTPSDAGDDDSGSSDAENGDSETDASDQTESGTDTDGSSDTDDSSGSADSDSQTDSEEDKPDEDPLADLRAEYEAAKKKYEDELSQYESDLKAWNEKVSSSREKAETLSRRFADWYYVIPGSTFDELRLSRDDLVKPKEDDDKADSNDADSSDAGSGESTSSSDEEDSQEESSDSDESASPEGDTEESSEESSDSASSPSDSAPTDDAATDAPSESPSAEATDSDVPSSSDSSQSDSDSGSGS